MDAVFTRSSGFSGFTFEMPTSVVRPEFTKFKVVSEATTFNPNFRSHVEMSSLVAYDHLNTVILTIIKTGLERASIMNLSGPLTVGWAIGLTVAIIVSAAGIAGTTFWALHSDINDVRTGASDDVSSLRSDMRSDANRFDAKFDKINDHLDKISGAIGDLRVEQAKNSPNQ